MAIQGMNHFNVLTDDVDAPRPFYCGSPALAGGGRPPFAFDGLWLYAGGRPILHVSANKLPKERAGVIDHIAFTGTDLKGTVAKLRAHGIKHTVGQQVGSRIWQAFCHAPMGAKVELDFAPAVPGPA